MGCPGRWRGLKPAVCFFGDVFLTHTQALKFWKIMKRFVTAYLDHYYGTGPAGDLKIEADQEVRHFLQQGLRAMEALQNPMLQARESCVTLVPNVVNSLPSPVQNSIKNASCFRSRAALAAGLGFLGRFARSSATSGRP